MKQFYVYLHCKPCGDPFYVGKGYGRRAYELSRNGRNEYHKRIVAKYGIEILVFPRDSEAQAHDDEIKWIAELRKNGFDLCNMTDGGEGMSGYKWSNEMREAQRIRATDLMKRPDIKKIHSDLGKKRPPIMLGKTHTHATKEKLSELSKGNTNRRGVKHTAESNAKNSATKKARYAVDFELRKRLSDALKGTKYSDERRSTHKAAMSSPEVRAKMSAAAKLRWKN